MINDTREQSEACGPLENDLREFSESSTELQMPMEPRKDQAHGFHLPHNVEHFHCLTRQR